MEGCNILDSNLGFTLTEDEWGNIYSSTEGVAQMEFYIDLSEEW